MDYCEVNYFENMLYMSSSKSRSGNPEMLKKVKGTWNRALRDLTAEGLERRSESESEKLYSSDTGTRQTQVLKTKMQDPGTFCRITQCFTSEPSYSCWEGRLCSGPGVLAAKVKSGI